MPTELGPDYWLAKTLSGFEDRLRNLETRDVLRNAAITAGGLTIKEGGSLWIEGTGAAYVNGLKLSSVYPVVFKAYATNFALGTSPTSLVSTTVSIPAGYTTGLVQMSVLTEFTNSNEYAVYGQTSSTAVASTGGTSVNSSAFNAYLPALGLNSLSIPTTGVLSGMDGGTVQIDGYAWGSVSMAASIYNAIVIVGQIVFLA